MGAGHGRGTSESPKLGAAKRCWMVCCESKAVAVRSRWRPGRSRVLRRASIVYFGNGQNGREPRHAKIVSANQRPGQTGGRDFKPASSNWALERTFDPAAHALAHVAVRIKCRSTKTLYVLRSVRR